MCLCVDAQVLDALLNVSMIIVGAEWLEPVTLQWAFEARSARLAISCATQIANAADPETGKLVTNYEYVIEH